MKISDLFVVKDFKEIIWRILYLVYFDVNVRKFFLVVSFLDLRYKDFFFVEKEECVFVCDVLLEVVIELYCCGLDIFGEEEIVI